MPNAIWKGHISFGLVSIPVSVYSSEDKSTTVSFHQIDKRNNARIKHQRVNVETGEEVPWKDVVKGYEYAKGEVLVVGEGELEKVAGENAKNIAIESFIDKNNLNFLNVERVYYLVPEKKGEKGYVILREALKDTNKVGVAKIIISTKEYLAAVSALEDALVVYILRYDEEIRKMSDFSFPHKTLSEYKINKKEIDIAKQLINSMSTKWKPAEYKDEYKVAVQKWLSAKMHARPAKTMKPRPNASAKNIVNFVDLLKKSLSEKKLTKNDSAYKFKKTKNGAKRKSLHH